MSLLGDILAHSKVGCYLKHLLNELEVTPQTTENRYFKGMKKFSVVFNNTAHTLCVHSYVLGGH